jgi:predicted RNA-binding Zn-ribbon protein involved in translation (DUF1610 family)
MTQFKDWLKDYSRRVAKLKVVPCPQCGKRIELKAIQTKNPNMTNYMCPECGDELLNTNEKKALAVLHKKGLL